MAELVFFSGTMDCGKSTLALQMDHNHRVRGRGGLIFTRLDRGGEAVLSSRLGLSTGAIEVTEDLDFWDVVVAHLTGGHRVDYVIGDEAQFYTPDHVEQLARLVDELDIDVYAFGDHGRLPYPVRRRSRRLIELLDLVHGLQVELRCAGRGRRSPRTTRESSMVRWSMTRARRSRPSVILERGR